MVNLKSFAAKLFARRVKSQINKWSSNPFQTQQNVFKELIEKAKDTQFGKDHNFSKISSYEEFKSNVPIVDYEGLRSYVDQVVAGKPNVLWPGLPLYFAKTSGTTSGVKYIPLTKESMPTHIEAARNAILMYIAETGKADFVNGKMIFLQGSPVLNKVNGVQLGRLSGIVAHYVPKYLQKNRMPSWETNCIEDWEEKVDAIVEETAQENMSVISGIPSWVQMYFERLQEKFNKPVGDLFKNFNLFIYGGVNYEPYRAKFEKLIGRKVDSIELYPASEGFFAFQDSQKDKGLLLQLNSGIFYEFIKVSDFNQNIMNRIQLKDVELNVNYVIIISTNAGLWAYNIGDTVMFTSLEPYRVVVSGRIKHYISAFGEHVIGKEVEEAMNKAIEGTEVSISEFTVAPQINPIEGLPYHEWFVEFDNKPGNIDEFSLKINSELQNQNIYYKDLINGAVLKPLVISVVKKGGFEAYMKSQGKLGGQNKVPRLSNDRKIADKMNDLKQVF